MQGFNVLDLSIFRPVAVSRVLLCQSVQRALDFHSLVIHWFLAWLCTHSCVLVVPRLIVLHGETWSRWCFHHVDLHYYHVYFVMASILKYKRVFTLTVICGLKDSLSMRATGAIVEKVYWHVNNQWNIRLSSSRNTYYQHKISCCLQVQLISFYLWVWHSLLWHCLKDLILIGQSQYSEVCYSPISTVCSFMSVVSHHGLIL